MRAVVVITLGILLLVSCDQSTPKIIKGTIEPSLSSKTVELTPSNKELQDFLNLILQAEAGDVTAQTKTADNYAVGRGVSVDFQEAVKWDRKAAAQNDARAQYNLGYMYYNGEALPRDYKRAVEWFTKAAKQGNSGAQCNLVLMYDNGEGVEENDEIVNDFERNRVIFIFSLIYVWN